ncbi:MAG: 50S ribosomal protein L21 [Coriobacteriia bacterium]|nr:50S ribosomal protein L21 [Coriobacteriia bacterium]
MYAIVKTGGKQYKVSEGDVLDVEKLDAQQGDTVNFDVLFLNDGKKAITEADALAKASVKAEVLEQGRGNKVLVFKFKRRKGYKRLKGHRQQFTKVKITGINA